MKLRPVRGAEDAEALYAVHEGRAARDGIEPTSPFEDFPSLENLRTALTEAVEAGQQDHWQVAEIGDHVVGYGQIECWLEADGTWVYLNQGWALPEWRGLARALLSRALHTVRARGASTVRLNTVAEFRTRAIDLYQSVGFGILKEFPRYRKPFPVRNANGA